MMATSERPAAAAPEKARPDLPGQVVLVLQGGGALGAYQVGVYEALNEAGIEPDWVIGTSIGAINGVVIAGNAVNERMERLRRFWALVERDGFGGGPLVWPPLDNLAANIQILAAGIHGFFTPNPVAAWGMHMPLGTEQAGFYSTRQLRDTLHKLVDTERLKSGQTRLTVGAVKLRGGEMHYFDSRDMALGLEHVMASSAFPPAFPAVRIDGELYWDGGIYSNTPIEAVFDDHPRRDSVVFAVQMWNPEGPEPDTLWQVLGRHKEIQYASRIESHIYRQQQIHQLRHVIQNLVGYLPEQHRDDPGVRRLTGYGCITTMHIVRLICPRLEGEDHTRDIDFTSAGIRARWQAGYADMRRMLARRPWEQEVDPTVGVAIHDTSVREPSRGTQPG